MAIKQLGTNGGGFFGPNSAHPFENPSAFSNVFECVAITLIPMACVVMFGVMLRNIGHARVIFGVMLAFLLIPGRLGRRHRLDAAEPGVRLIAPRSWTSHGKPYRMQTLNADGKAEVKELSAPALVGLPVDQSGLGNTEGKELRFGVSAGPTWAALTTCTSNGSVNCMHDSLNPLAGLTPLTGMWLNCNFGGVGVGLINLLIYLILAVFFAGLMVGRTPEYLGKKVEAREMKLAAIALLAHPAVGAGADRAVRGARLGHCGDQQPRPPRVQRDFVRVHFVEREQRLRVRGAWRHVRVQRPEDEPDRAGDVRRVLGHRNRVW